MTPRDPRPLVLAGVVLGIGMGGFVDGIVFHQILQLHEMLSAWVPKRTLVDVEVNMFWDGLFHACTWATTAAGIALLFRAGARRDVAWSGRVFVGALAIGWGAFNVVEGVVDHVLLQVHHVVERLGLSVWDAVFVASGVALLAAGVAAVRGEESGRSASRAGRSAR
jgi:uncharacterized membrane protein